MQADVASGALHPMEAKKRLARTIVAGFHSKTAVAEADEGWARQFQLHELPADLEEVIVAATRTIRVDKLLLRLGMAESATDAQRKLKQGAVRIEGEVLHAPHVTLATLPADLPVRVGKRARLAAIH